ncbi:MAG: hypothetical protein HYS04_16205 [Acidobacteria bacterium]|nr:hypothetical protein [Acidobacteriota bacterium]
MVCTRISSTESGEGENATVSKRMLGMLSSRNSERDSEPLEEKSEGPNVSQGLMAVGEPVY